MLLFYVFILCFFSQQTYAQKSVRKEFDLKTVPSTKSNQKLNLILLHEEEREFEFPDSLGKYDYFIFENELKNHLTKIGKQQEQYWDKLPILLCYNKKKLILSLDSDHDNSFEGEEFFVSNNLDSVFNIDFNFQHKYDSSKDVSIPVNLKVLFSAMQIRLTLQYDEFFSTGEIDLDDNANQINVFPFTGMARYEVRTANQDDSEIYFNDELIDVDGIYWRVDSFDYPSKKIWLDSVGVIEKPVGYRVGQYIQEDIVREAFNKLHIGESQVGFSKNFTILHFWGEWCQPCLDEIPRLQKLLSRIDNEKVDVVHVNFLAEKSDRFKTLEFISSSTLLGAHLIDDASAEFSLVQLLNSRTFPGYVIFDSDFKIVYRSDDRKLNLPSFLKSIGLL